MRLFIAWIIFLIFPVSLFAVSVSDRIEMWVSPIRHEFTVTPWLAVQKVITFYNHADVPYTLYMSTEDCTADSLVGTPKCRTGSSAIGDPLYFSSWVSFVWPINLVVPPKSEIQVTVNINPPLNAVPGGRYGAVFFNRPTGGVDPNAVKMIQRIGTLFLVTVPGAITYDTVYGTIQIWPGGWRGVAGVGSNLLYPSPKSTLEYWLTRLSGILDPTLNAPSLPQVKDFDIDFQIPVKNNGNVHILPVWRIEILDENGLPLKSIGKESIRSPEWAYIWERIVDYLPINDEWWNVLPNSDRLYGISWKWFAYETIEWGKSTIKFLSPQDYYKQLQADESPYLLPWEKYRLVPVSKLLQAKIYLEYSGSWNAPVPYEVDREITVDYFSLEKTINYGAIIILWLILFLIWMIFFIRGRDRRIDEMEEELGYIEAEVDELEKWRKLAQKALAKKSEQHTLKNLPKASPTTISPKKTVPKKLNEWVAPKKSSPRTKKMPE